MPATLSGVGRRVTTTCPACMRPISIDPDADPDTAGVSIDCTGTSDHPEDLLAVRLAVVVHLNYGCNSLQRRRGPG